MARQRLTEKSFLLVLVLSMIFPFLYKHPETRRAFQFHLIVWMLQRRGLRAGCSDGECGQTLVLIYLSNDPILSSQFLLRIFRSTLKFEAFVRDVIARVELQSSIDFLWCEFLFVVITLCKTQNMERLNTQKSSGKKAILPVFFKPIS